MNQDCADYGGADAATFSRQDAGATIFKPALRNRPRPKRKEPPGLRLFFQSL
jgi:hypothetical protein